MKPFLFFLLSFTTLAVIAQEQPVKHKKYDLYFYGKDRKQVSTQDSAEIIEMVSEPDSGSKLYNVERFNKDRKIIFAGTSSEIHPTVLQGPAMEYYTNGKRKIAENYKDDHLTGIITYYYINGKTASIRDSKSATHPYDADSYIITAADTLGKVIVNSGNGYYIGRNENMTRVTEEGLLANGMREGEWKGYSIETRCQYVEYYKKGILLNGVSTDSLGKTYTYKVINEWAEYPRGMQALMGFIERKIRYPDSSYNARKSGLRRVNVVFEINTMGKAENFKVTDAPDKYMTQEAISVLSKMALWQPAKYRGVKVNWSIALPIYFNHP